MFAGRDLINRSYYAAFYDIKAVHALETVDFKRHKDVMAYLIRNNILQRKHFQEN
ncbi:MAG: HEPN domain-containing protein [Clostridiales bacterium]|nr:HEPN domain-containing protein [Clostridiales bacterium]